MGEEGSSPLQVLRYAKLASRSTDFKMDLLLFYLVKAHVKRP